jgi:hypothetical protein
MGQMVRQSPGERARAEYDSLAATYSIVIRRLTQPFRKSGEGSIRGDPAPADALEAYAPILARELRKYPVPLLRRSGIREILLCRRLEADGAPAGGLSTPQEIAKRLYLNVEDPKRNDERLRRVLHHEVFHFIDVAIGKEICAYAEWESLNAEGFGYGAGGRGALEDPDLRLPHRELPGFLNRYAMAGPEEDRAEVFAAMMVCFPAMEARAERDPILRAKMARIERIVRALCPEIDEDYWKTLAVTVTGI